MHLPKFIATFAKYMEKEWTTLLQKLKEALIELDRQLTENEVLYNVLDKSNQTEEP